MLISGFLKRFDFFYILMMLIGSYSIMINGHALFTALSIVLFLFWSIKQLPLGFETIRLVQAAPLLLFFSFFLSSLLGLEYDYRVLYFCLMFITLSLLTLNLQSKISLNARSIKLIYLALFFWLVWLSLFALLGSLINDDRFYYQGYVINGSAYNFFIVIFFLLLLPVLNTNFKYNKNIIILGAIFLVLTSFVAGLYDSRIAYVLVQFVSIYYLINSKFKKFAASFVILNLSYLIGLATIPGMVIGLNFSVVDFVLRYTEIASLSLDYVANDLPVTQDHRAFSDIDRLLPLTYAVNFLSSVDFPQWFFGSGMYAHKFLLFNEYNQFLNTFNLPESTNHGVFRTSSLPGLLIDTGYFGVSLLLVAYINILFFVYKSTNIADCIFISLLLTLVLCWTLLMNVTISPLFFMMFIPGFIKIFLPVKA